VSDKAEPTREEFVLLYSYGFHEVEGLDDVWRRGRVGDVAVDARVFSRAEALELIKRIRREQEYDV
jgi:hypothetical protein